MNLPEPTSSPSRPPAGLRRARRLLFLSVALVSVVVFFYAVENWRGRRALEACRRELEAKGEKLAWADWLAVPPPAASNFFKAPGMEALFVQTNGQTKPRKGVPSLPAGYDMDFPFSMAGLKRLPLQATRPEEKSLAGLRVWFEQQQEVYRQIELAAQRPAAQLERNPEAPFESEGLQFVAFRKSAQFLASRTKVQLLAGQPAEAGRSLALVGRLAEITGEDHPPFLVQSMIGTAIAGLYVQTLQEGLAERLWPEPQLAACQTQLQRLEVLGFVRESLCAERAGVGFMLEHWPADKLAKALAGSNSKRSWLDPEALLLWLTPRGWLLQNEVALNRLEQGFIEAIEPQGRWVNPRRCQEATRTRDGIGQARGPYTWFAGVAAPNLGRAVRAAAQNQSSLRQALIACALERFRLAMGGYPESLDVLVPRFLEAVPPDVIVGAALQYRRQADASYLLYSVGWNQQDDGGREATDAKGTRQPESGDWVWNLKAA